MRVHYPKEGSKNSKIKIKKRCVKAEFMNLREVVAWVSGEENLRDKGGQQSWQLLKDYTKCTMANYILMWRKDRKLNKKP